MVVALDRGKKMWYACIDDDEPMVVIEKEYGPEPWSLTVFEAEGLTIIKRVPGGWQKFEGKWSIGFGPKTVVFRPISPVRRRKSDLEDKVQSTNGTGRPQAVQRRGVSGERGNRG